MPKNVRIVTPDDNICICALTKWVCLVKKVVQPWTDQSMQIDHVCCAMHFESVNCVLLCACVRVTVRTCTVGGRDKREGPILSVVQPADVDMELLMELTVEEIIDMLAYFTFVPRLVCWFVKELSAPTLYFSWQEGRDISSLSLMYLKHATNDLFISCSSKNFFILFETVTHL